MRSLRSPRVYACGEKSLVWCLVSDSITFDEGKGLRLCNAETSIGQRQKFTTFETLFDRHHGWRVTLRAAVPPNGWQRSAMNRCIESASRTLNQPPLSGNWPCKNGSRFSVSTGCPRREPEGCESRGQVQNRRPFVRGPAERSDLPAVPMRWYIRG